MVTDYAPVGGRAHFNLGLDRLFAGYAIALPNACDTAPLQAADLLVHLTYAHMRDSLSGGKKARMSPLLSACLRNSRSPQDHQFQDGNSLQRILEQKRGELEVRSL
jgi:hypothetical protein